MKIKNTIKTILAIASLISVQGYAYDFSKEILSEMPAYSENYAEHEGVINFCAFDCLGKDEEGPATQACYDKCSKKGPFYGYVIPNEDFPGEAKALYEKLEAGTAFMSVGTERSFFGAALSKADRLLIVDMDIDICLFSHINRALLKVSEDREDYVWLRLEASTEDWAKRFEEKGIAFEGMNEGEGASVLWKYWNNRVRNVKTEDKEIIKALKRSNSLDLLEVFDSMHNGTGFKDANYLFDDELFSHLRELAVSDRIHVYQQSILDLGEESKLVQDLKELDITIGMIDLSNAYSVPGYCAGVGVGSGYIRTLQFANFMLDIAPYTNENSWVVTIDMAHSFYDSTDNSLFDEVPVSTYNAAQVQGLLPKGDLIRMQELAKLDKEWITDPAWREMCEDYDSLRAIMRVIDNAVFERIWAPECVTDKEAWPVIGSGN